MPVRVTIRVSSSHPADSGVIESRLYRDHHARRELRVVHRDARRFVNLEPESVTGSVKEALHAPVDIAGLEAAFSNRASMAP
jgi:hypothetical protein